MWRDAAAVGAALCALRLGMLIERRRCARWLEEHQSAWAGAPTQGEMRATIWRAIAVAASENHREGLVLGDTRRVLREGADRAARALADEMRGGASR
jgi:hypothetical protein